MMAFLKELISYNRPVWAIVVGFFANIIHGCTTPFLGLMIVQCIFAMNNPVVDTMIANVNYWVGWIAIIGLTELLTGFIGKFMFVVVGENITYNVRKDLYVAILQKHMGWHDIREHSAGNLTTVLAKEVQTLNGVSTESVSVITESAIALCCGIAIGFYFCWQEAVAAVVLVPIMVVSAILQSKYDPANEDFGI